MNGGNNKLVVVLGGMILVIIGLIIAIVVVNIKQRDNLDYEDTVVSEIDNLADVGQQMTGWDGPIDDTTKAFALKESIDKRLKSDSSYDSEDAIMEYDEAYDLADGDLKCYIAIYYADYYFSSTQDLTKSVDILEQIDTATLDIEAETSRLYALKDLYDSVGDNEKAELYAQRIDALIPDGSALIDLEEKKNE